MSVVHPADHERNEGHPEKQEEIGPQHNAIDPFGNVQHVMMVIPEDSDVDKAQGKREKGGYTRGQRGKIRTRGYLQVEHHDRDDDGKHSIRERFET